MPFGRRSYHFSCKKALTILIFLFSSSSSISQTIFTYAGSGSGGYSGDGGAALAAAIPYPKDICVDKAGNIYLTCYNNVRKINPVTGIITTIAGTGNAGYSGDGGPATQAEMRFPWGITTDSTGNIFIAEYSSGRIRKVDGLSGKIYTVAGTGYPGYNGDGIPAINAHLNSPQGIAIDNKGNIYFTDAHNYRVRKIDAITGIISTVAGNGVNAYSGDGGPAIASSLAFPSDVIIDKAGNLLISESSEVSCRIRKVNILTGIITTIAGNGIRSHSGDGGLAINASLFEPTSLCMDASGALFISQYVDARIRKIDPVTGIITTLSGTGIAGYSGDCGPAKDAQLNFPEGLSFDKTGTLFVVDNSNHRIRKIVPENSPNNTAVLVSASDTLICPGTAVTFTATPVNTGPNLIYQWKVNNSLVGTNSKTFTSTALKNNDTVRCILTVFSTCGNIFYLNSNTITIKTKTGISPSIRITANKNEACSGTPVTFNASTNNSGTASTFQWQINGQPMGSGIPTFTTNKLKDADKVTCLFTTKQNGCLLPVTVSSDTIQLKIKPVPSITFLKDSFYIHPGETIPLTVTLSAPVMTFQWTPAALVSNTNSLTTVSAPIYTDSRILFSLLTTEGCPAKKEVIITLIRGLNIPNAFTPNGDGKNELFRIPFGVDIILKEFTIFDRWGHRVFSTQDVSKGWDGQFKGRPSPSGTYVYIIAGKGSQGDFVFKGTVTLVR